MRSIKSILRKIPFNHPREIFGMDPRTLAAFRIGVACMLLADLILRFGDIEAFYTDFGVLPRNAYPHLIGRWLVSFHMMSGQWIMQAMLFGLAGICAVCVLIGYKTQSMTVFSWVMLTSLQNRNPILLQGGDDLIRVLVFWGMFLRWGDFYSIDSKRRGTLPPDKPVVIAGTAAYLFQFFIFYFFAYLLKTGKEWSVEGSAVFLALNQDMMAKLPGHFLLQFPELLKFLTFAVLYTEMIVPIIIFCPIFNAPIRIACFLALAGMQTGFGSCLRVGLFPYISFVASIPILPPLFWNTLSEWWWKSDSAKANRPLECRGAKSNPGSDTGGPSRQKPVAPTQNLPWPQFLKSSGVALLLL
ncbi:MAG: HTTM domain-containing protein, partial [Planctomycetota bacterium]|nr:HTTM domain-containing protein [Planctomycetota bacterium]